MDVSATTRHALEHGAERTSVEAGRLRLLRLRGVTNAGRRHARLRGGADRPGGRGEQQESDEPPARHARSHTGNWNNNTIVVLEPVLFEDSSHSHGRWGNAPSASVGMKTMEVRRPSTDLDLLLRA